MVAILSTIRFPELGLYVHISRKHHLAGVFDEKTLAPVGAITRQPRGSLSWEVFGERKLPIEILATIATMV